MDFALLQLKADGVIGYNAWKTLRYVGKLNNGNGCIHRITLPVSFEKPLTIKEQG
jgi:hypothetical protein